MEAEIEARSARAQRPSLAVMLQSAESDSFAPNEEIRGGKMNIETSYAIDRADRMRLGEQCLFTRGILMAAFGSDLPVYGTLEAAFCANLFGGAEGAYTLREDRKTNCFILSRHWTPS